MGNLNTLTVAELMRHIPKEDMHPANVPFHQTMMVIRYVDISEYVSTVKGWLVNASYMSLSESTMAIVNEIMNRLPQRIQRKRSKGWRMPGNTVYVGRGSKWGNPFKIGDKLSEVPDVVVHLSSLAHKKLEPGDVITRDLAIDLFKVWQYWSSDNEAGWMREHIRELKGKSLACWCPLTCSCHADYLLKIANV